MYLDIILITKVIIILTDIYKIYDNYYKTEI